MDSFIPPGTRVSEENYMLKEGISLHVSHFKPMVESQYPALVLLPGLASVLENFRQVVVGLAKDFELYYVETREKKSSSATRNSNFSMEALSDDLDEFLELTGLYTQPYILCGYSLGATVILNAYSHLKVPPQLIVLAEPNGSFSFPSWLLFLSRFAIPLYPIIKPFLKWYIRTFRIDMKTDPELYHINCRILDSADPYKLAAVVREISHYKVWDKLQIIQTPVLLITASKDRFHSYPEALAIAARIQGCHIVDLENNQRTHSTEPALEIIKCWEGINNAQFPKQNEV